MALVTVKNLGLTFGQGDSASTIIKDVSFKVAAGEIVAIRGPNGTGKTTLLNIIAGIYQATEGTVECNDGSDEALIAGFIQQDYTSSMLPWFNALENIAIPLRLQGVPAAIRKERVEAQLNELGFKNLPIGAYPHQLSGGQKQRIAIARSLMAKPKLLLLDEPYANLDGPAVKELQKVLLHVHSHQRMTMILVSHDLDSAIYLADRIILIHGQPATVKSEIPVTLGRPRTRDMLVSEKFSKIRAAILKEEEHFYGEYQ